jgi:PAS domain S-box-containing protein
MSPVATRQTFAEAASAAGLLEPWSASLELAVLFDPEGQVLAVNRAFARKFGQALPMWNGFQVTSLLHPEDADNWAELGQQLNRPPYHIWQSMSTRS